MKRAVVISLVLTLVLISAVTVLAAAPLDFGKRLHVDSRWIEKIMASPPMSYEQGEDWLADWEGPVAYVAWNEEESATRQVYFASKEGYDTFISIQEVTKLTYTETYDAVTKLEAEDRLPTPIKEVIEK